MFKWVKWIKGNFTFVRRKHFDAVASDWAAMSDQLARTENEATKYAVDLRAVRKTEADVRRQLSDEVRHSADQETQLTFLKGKLAEWNASVFGQREAALKAQIAEADRKVAAADLDRRAAAKVERIINQNVKAFSTAYAAFLETLRLEEETRKARRGAKELQRVRALLEEKRQALHEAVIAVELRIDFTDNVKDEVETFAKTASG